jgi:hypothetical protein
VGLDGHRSNPAIFPKYESSGEKRDLGLDLVGDRTGILGMARSLDVASNNKSAVAFEVKTRYDADVPPCFASSRRRPAEPAAWSSVAAGEGKW